MEEPGPKVGMQRSKLKRGLLSVEGILSRPWSVGMTLILLAGGSLALFAHAYAYRGFFADDSLISLRYTQRFIEGHGLTWNDGEYVEGYSNLLWVILCAIPGILGVDLVFGAKVLGFLSTLATFGAFLWVAQPKRAVDGVAPFVAMLLLSATDAIAVWTMGGLEAPLVMALACVGTAALILYFEEPTRRRLAIAALSFGALAWTRPDAPLLSGSVGLGFILIHRKKAIRPILIVALVTSAFVAAQLIFRIIYYGDYLPNTAYAKLASGEKRIKEGLSYWQDSLIPLAGSWLTLLFASFSCMMKGGARKNLAVLLGVTALWVAYIASIGGDIFPAWRHGVPVVGVAGLVLTLMAKQLLASEGARSVWRWGVTLAALSLVGMMADPRNWARRETWEWDGVPVSRVLRTAFREEQPLIGVDAAGSIPYFSRLPALDLFGLTDRYLAHHRSASVGDGALAHELGDAEYYLRRAPDIFCFGVPPCFKTSQFPEQQSMLRKREFKENYSLVFVESFRGKQPLVSELWVRREGRIGVERTSHTVTIPVILLATSREAPARWEGGELVVRIPKGHSATVGPLLFEPGQWRGKLGTSRGGLVDVMSSGNKLYSGSAEEIKFYTEEAKALRFVIRTKGEGFELTQMSFSRPE